MRFFLALLLCAIPLRAQTTGTADTSGSCSPAVTGNNNQFTISCPGVSSEQGHKLLDILNKILANEIDSKVVMAKLEEISKEAAKRPWVQIKNPTLGGPLTINERGLDASVTTPLENTTETPAIAAVDSLLFLMTEPHSKAAIIKLQDQLCDNLERKMKNDQVVTTTLFHELQRYATGSGLHIDAKEMNEAVLKLNDNEMPPNSPTKIIDPIVLSCVVYRATSGGPYYRTAYANMVMRPIPFSGGQSSVGGSLVFQPGVLKPEQLWLVPDLEVDTRVK